LIYRKSLAKFLRNRNKIRSFCGKGIWHAG
jgi:hypothetical protein